LLLAACSERPSAPSNGAVDASTEAPGDADTGPNDASDANVPSGGFDLASFPGGFDDAFSLPPEFAPALPLVGAEVTREPPGMYDTTSEFLFSYAILWWLEGSPALDTESLRDYLLVYYTGLCGGGAVTLDEPTAPGPNDAGVGLARRGTLTVEWCLGVRVPPSVLEVTTFACSTHDAVLTTITPAPAESAAHAELARIRDSFRCF
jgi:hypothetical protein